MNTERVAELNDKLRDKILYANPIKDKINMTKGISELTSQQQLYILNRVKNFKDFNKGDNPHGERDFGAFNNEEDILRATVVALGI